MEKEIFKLLDWKNRLIQFNEEEHKYYVWGDNKPSVSAFIGRLRTKKEQEKMDSDFMQKFLEPYAEFGTRVHLKTELIDRGVAPFKLKYKDFSNIKRNEMEAVKNYISLMKRFKEINHIEKQYIEIPLYSYVIDHCGTIDRLLIDKDNNAYLLDIKTGSTRDSHWYQQLVYEKMLLVDYGIEVKDILLVSLKENKIIKFSDLKENKQDKLSSMVEKIWSSSYDKRKE